MFDLVLGLEASEDLDISTLKANVAGYAAKITKSEDYEHVRNQLKEKCLIKLKQVPPPVAAAKPQPEAKADKKTKDHAGAKK